MASMGYSNSTCTSGCKSFDTHFSSCINNSTDSISAQCVCQPSDSIGSLNACTVCNLNALGGNDLSVYQQWDVICNSYADQGEQTAEGLATEPDTNGFIDIFSSSLLPQLQSSSQATGTPTIGAISTTNLPTCSADPSASMTGSMGSPTMGQSPATSSSAAVSNAVVPHSLGGMLAVLSVFGSLLGLL